MGSGAGAYEYGTVPGWTISGNPGEAANGSAFGVTGATNGNSDGTTSTAGQAALFQGGDGTLTGTAITQSVTIPRGPLTINFAAEERGCCSGTNNESLNVYLDGNLIDTVTSSQLSTGSFTSFSTPATAVLAAGAHTIGFAGSPEPAIPPYFSTTSACRPPSRLRSAFSALPGWGFLLVVAAHNNL